MRKQLSKKSVASLTAAMATATGSGFAGISGEVYAADTNVKDLYGSRVAH